MGIKTKTARRKLSKRDQGHLTKCKVFCINDLIKAVKEGDCVDCKRIAEKLDK